MLTSKFPTLTVAKIRYKISGKGYLGKMKLLSINDTMYELELLGLSKDERTVKEVCRSIGVEDGYQIHLTGGRLWEQAHAYA